MFGNQERHSKEKLNSAASISERPKDFSQLVNEVNLSGLGENRFSGMAKVKFRMLL